MKKFEKMLTSTIAKIAMLGFCILSAMFCIGVGAMYAFDTLIIVALIAGASGTVVTGYSILQDMDD
jgi:hypothetical protein